MDIVNLVQAKYTAGHMVGGCTATIAACGECGSDQHLSVLEAWDEGRDSDREYEHGRCLI